MQDFRVLVYIKPIMSISLIEGIWYNGKIYLLLLPDGNLYKLDLAPLKYTHTCTYTHNCNLVYLILSSLWNGLGKKKTTKIQWQRKRLDWLVQVWAGCEIAAGMGKEGIQLYAMKGVLQTPPECLWGQMLCTPIGFLKLIARCYASYVP